MLRILLFGFPSVSLDDAPVTDFISQKSLALLCYLLLEPRIHARETLAGLFWGEMPQERALSNLRQALHNLQKLLPAYITVTRQTVCFNTRLPFSTDIEKLNDAPLNADVLDVYRDGFMAGMHLGDAAEVERWIERKREAYSQRYGLQLEKLMGEVFAASDMAQAERVARRLTTHDPYHEAAHRILWRTLVYHGHIAEALNSAESLRQLLQTELDITPSPETQRYVGQMLLAQDAVRHNIPTPVSPFIGREADIAHIQQQLRQPECRLVTVSGIGGTGKTRLAEETGRIEARHHLNGAAYIPLSAVTDMVYLHSALADGLGFSLKNVADPQREIEQFLAQREMLLIFDNAEHLAGFAGWLAALLPAVPFIKILVTSRQSLNLREEWVFPLSGLPFTDSDTAVELLVSTAARRGQKIARDHDADALCVLLEGLPLGIELAGSMLAAENTATVLNAVRANLDYLQAGWINADPHHRNLRAVFQTTWGMLSADEKSALADLSLFDFTFTGDAAQSVARVSAPLLAALETWSLIKVQAGRWSMHPVIRAYAREFQHTTGELIARFEQYHLHIIAQAEALFTARDVRAGIAAVHAEIEGLRQLWRILFETRQIQNLVRLSFTLHRFYEGMGWFAEGQALFHQNVMALDLQNPDEAWLFGRLKMHEAGLLLRLGKPADGLESARDAVISLSRREDDPAGMAFALNALGVAQLYLGDMSTAQRTLEQCADIYRELNQPELLKPLINLGSIYSRTGESDSARAVLREAHGIATRIGDSVGLFHVANALGLNYMLRDDYAEARHYFAEALELSDSAGFLSGKTIVLSNLGEIYTLLEQPQDGLRYASEAVSLARQLEDKRALIYSLTAQLLARIALKQPESIETLKQALQAANELQAPPLLAVALYAASEWYASVNQLDEAQHLWRVLATHPATEMDYRRRARRRLNDAIVPLHDEPAMSLSAIITDVMTQLA